MAKFVSRKTVKRNSFKEMAEETWNRRVESTCGPGKWNRRAPWVRCDC